MLICDGKFDEKALQAESLRPEELMTVIHKDGVDTLGEVKRCTLEPNGTFYVERYSPLPDEVDRKEMMESLAALRSEVKELRELLVASRLQ